MYIYITKMLLAFYYQVFLLLLSDPFMLKHMMFVGHCVQKQLHSF